MIVPCSCISMKGTLVFFFFLTLSDMLKSTQARAFVLGMSSVVRKPWVY